MRTRLIVFFCSIVIVHMLSAETVRDVMQSFRTSGLYSSYLESYVNMAKIKNIPDEKLISLLQTKKEYLQTVRVVKPDIKNSSFDMILYFSDMGITPQTVVVFFDSGKSEDFMPALKELITVLISSYESSADELNTVYRSSCEKNYSASDISGLASQLRQLYLHSGGKKAREIRMIVVKNMTFGNSIKYIIRSIQEVLR